MKNIKTFDNFVNEEFGLGLGLGLGVLVGLTGLGIQELIKLWHRMPTKKLIKEIIEMINKYKDDEIISKVINKIENDETFGLKGHKDIEYLTRPTKIKNRFEELMDPEEFRIFNFKLKRLSDIQLYNINLDDIGIFQL